MAKKEDELTRLRKNKTGTRFSELEQILKHRGWILQSVSGSHHVYSKPKCLPIMIVKPHGNQKYCHPMDVNKVIAALEPESLKTEEEPMKSHKDKEQRQGKSK